MHLPVIPNGFSWESHTVAAGPPEGAGRWPGRHSSVTLNPSLGKSSAGTLAIPAAFRALTDGLVHSSANPTSNADKSAKTNDEIQYLNLKKLEQLGDEKKKKTDPLKSKVRSIFRSRCRHERVATLRPRLFFSSPISFQF